MNTQRCAGLGLTLLLLASPAVASFESVGIYQSFNELVAWCDAFEAANPDLVHVVRFGDSWEGRPLIAFQVTEPGGGRSTRSPRPAGRTAARHSPGRILRGIPSVVARTRERVGIAADERTVPT